MSPTQENLAREEDREKELKDGAMIPADRLEKLKQLFAEDGITITDTEALEIGLWLLARVKPVLRPIPLDKMESFATIKGEARTIRHTTPFVNLYEWRQKNVKNKKLPQ
jgi:hypothetical protein